MRTGGQKIGVVAGALSSDPRAAPRIARSLGFGGLLFEAYSNSLKLPELSASGRRDFVHMLSSQAQHLIGLAVDGGAKGLGPGADVDRFLDRVDRAMEAAAGLGARLVCVDPGPLPPAPRKMVRKPEVSPQEAGLIIIPSPREVMEAPPMETARPVDPALVAQVTGALTELGRRADRYGATVAIRSELSNLASVEHALTAADCPHFGVDLDPVALLRDDWSIGEAFSRLGPLIHHVRVRDALRGEGGRTKSTVVGAGNVNWGEFLSALDEATYQGWLTIDPAELADRAAAATAALGFIRSR